MGEETALAACACAYLDLLADLTLGELEVILGGAIVVHEGEETILIDVQKLVVLALDDGDVHVVGGGRHILELLAGEDVDGSQVDLQYVRCNGAIELIGV